ncbi:Uncharacterized protein APZ42_032246 [Daphnia magna]|uniref:ISXO2-like transposase domain-containing protein n=1 Tax=Daphnia magna TaxID=35525 RepID=A0A164M584_9CRUS|nr:Uncharacterized protein APZ42_032246 [Daphnia magna]
MTHLCEEITNLPFQPRHYTILLLLYVLIYFTIIFFKAHGTPIDWYNFCREVSEDVVINNSEKIGGIGFTVEIDESKFGKRKYNQGKRVGGVWVFNGVKRWSGKCFLVAVIDRSANTLQEVIKELILPGSIIISDCWKAYDKLE